MITIVALWTSSLVVVDGELVAKHCVRARRLELVSIVHAEPGLLVGLIFKTDEGQSMRSLVSGRAWDEFWTTRAEKICDAIELLAQIARDEREGR